MSDYILPNKRDRNNSLIKCCLNLIYYLCLSRNKILILLTNNHTNKYKNTYYFNVVNHELTQRFTFNFLLFESM